LIQNKFEFMYQIKIPPSEFDTMAYWEFEYYIDLLNEKVKEENKRNKEQQEQQNTNMPNMPNYKDMGKNFGNFKPPKF